MENLTINKEKKTDLFKVDPRSIIANEADNPRDSYNEEHIEYLMKSILENGMETPMKGIRGSGKDKGKYILTQGFHRYKAVMIAIKNGEDIKYVPMILKSSKGYTVEQRLLETLNDNSGHPLTLLEQSAIMLKFEKRQWTQEQISKKVGKTQAHVSNCIKLAKMTAFMQNQIKEGVLSPSKALGIIKEYPNEIDQKEVVEKSLNKMKKMGKEKILQIVGKRGKAAPKRTGKYHKMFSEVIELAKTEQVAPAKITKIERIVSLLDMKQTKSIMNALLEIL